jgi:hypothetical protein
VGGGAKDHEKAGHDEDECVQVYLPFGRWDFVENGNLNDIPSFREECEVFQCGSVPSGQMHLLLLHILPLEHLPQESVRSGHAQILNYFYIIIYLAPQSSQDIESNSKGLNSYDCGKIYMRIVFN